MTQRADKPVLVPDERHPISVTPTDGTVVVTVGDRVVAESTHALTLAEAGYPPVQYLPLGDVDASVLEPSDHATYCPYKGDAAHHDLVVDGVRRDHAVWTYPQPHDAVAPIAGHVAFYPDGVTVEVR